MFFELCLLFMFLFVLRLYVFKSREERMLEQFPGPKCYPLVGSMLEFDYPRVEVTETFKRLSMKYGPVYLMKLARDPMVFLRDPADVEIILRSPTELEKSRAIYWQLWPWLNEGLLTSKSETWRKHRKILTPAFHFKILESFLPTFVKQTNVLIDKLSDVVGQEFDVTQFLELCSLDIIAETAMGIKLNAQREENSKYVKAINELKNIVANRSFNILHRSPLFNLLPAGRKHNALVKYVHKYTESVIEERRAKLYQTTSEKDKKVTKVEDNDVGIREKKVFMDLLLQYNSEGAGLTDSQIRNEVDTFMFAGYDTTSTTVAFCLYCLSQNQDVQDLVYEEICTVLDDNDRELTLEDLNQMKYLGKVIYETLRIYPTAQFVSRQTSCDVQLNSGYVVPANTSITVLIEAMNHDPALHTDPFKFDPNRFDTKPDNPYTFVPFSAGPRNCIGQRYAMLEIKTVVSLILKKFRLLPSNIPVQPVFTVTLKSKTGIYLKLEHR